MPRFEHDLSFTTPAPTWDEGLPLGNGILGALIWGDGNPLNISLDRTDLWDLRPVPEYHSPDYNNATVRRWKEEGRHEELKRMLEEPYNRPAPTKIPAGRIEIRVGALETSTLDIEQAVSSLKFADGATAQVFLHAKQAVGVIRIRSLANPEFHLQAPAFAGEVSISTPGGIRAGDVARLGYDAPAQSSGHNFQAFEQQGWDKFQFAVYLSWCQDGEDILAAWAIASTFEGEDVFEIARQRVESAFQQGYDVLLESHQAWWREYWAQSSLALPDKDLEKQWFLDTYKFGAAARRNAPPVTLQGPWTADDGGLPPWKGDYHHDLNTQLSYWPCYSGNHLEEGLGFLDWLWGLRDNCREWTQRAFEVPGLNIPITTDLRGNPIGGWRHYTFCATAAAWLCHHFYLHWKYSADCEFLEKRAYPYLSECSVFIEAITVERDANGLRTIPLSISPEIHENKPEAWFTSVTNYELSLIRWLLGATAELAGELGKNDDARRWSELLAQMPELALGEDGHLLIAPGESLEESHRHHSHLMAIHPLGLITCESETGRRIINASLAQIDKLGTSQWVGYSFAWRGKMAARVGDGERAARELKKFLSFVLPNSFHANGDQSGLGYSNFTYRPFTLEGNFAFAAAIQEMLLQSWGGVLRIFPAIPDDWEDVSFDTLRGEGAFLVSAEMKNGNLTRLDILAERDGLCRVLLRGESVVREAELRSGEVWNVCVSLAEMTTSSSI
jgi:alpha-L-fucosidase 2